MKSLRQPALLDLLAQPASEDIIMEEVEDLRPSKRKVVYPEVLLYSLFSLKAFWFVWCERNLQLTKLPALFSLFSISPCPRLLLV